MQEGGLGPCHGESREPGGGCRSWGRRRGTRTKRKPLFQRHPPSVTGPEWGPCSPSAEAQGSGFIGCHGDPWP